MFFITILQSHFEDRLKNTSLVMFFNAYRQHKSSNHEVGQTDITPSENLSTELGTDIINQFTKYNREQIMGIACWGEERIQGDGI